MNRGLTLLRIIGISILSFSLTSCESTGTRSNDYTSCVGAAVGGAIIGYLLGDDTESALIGGTVGILGCAVIKHIGASNAKKVEEWKAETLKGNPHDERVVRSGEIQSDEGETIQVELTSEPAQSVADLDRADLAESRDWITASTYCRPAKVGVTLSGKTTNIDLLECLNEEGDFVEVEAMVAGEATA